MQKLTLAASAASLGFAAAVTLGLAASAGAQVFAGDTTGEPTFNRPVSPTGLSGVGTAVPYEVFNVEVDTTGDYVVTMTQIDADFDTYLLVYSDFDPNSPLDNLLAGDDDLVFGVSSQVGTGSGYGPGDDPLTLVVGQDYDVVATGFNNLDFGAYSLTFTGPGVVSIVPEPAALSVAGLAGLALVRRRRA